MEVQSPCGSMLVIIKSINEMKVIIKSINEMKFKADVDFVMLNKTWEESHFRVELKEISLSMMKKS